MPIIMIDIHCKQQGEKERLKLKNSMGVGTCQVGLLMVPFLAP